MQPERADNPVLSYKCPNETAQPGVKCSGVLVFRPGQLVAQCDICQTWTGYAAPDLVPLKATNNGATQGTAGRMVLTVDHSYFGGLKSMTLTCADSACYFKLDLGRRTQVQAVVAEAYQHPCPMPKPENLDPEPLPMPEEAAPSDSPYE